MKNLKQAYSEFKANNGLSFNPNNMDENGHFQKPLGGYMVSQAGSELVLFAHRTNEFIFNETIKAYINTFANELQTGAFIGVWNDEKGRIYFDISYNITDAKEAILTGYNERQIAIFDVKNEKVVTLPKAQTKGTEAQKKAYQLQKANIFKKTGQFFDQLK